MLLPYGIQYPDGDFPVEKRRFKGNPSCLLHYELMAD